MKKSITVKRVLYFLIPLFLIGLIVVKLKKNKDITEGKVYQFDKNQAIHVQADTIQFESVSDGLTYSGSFEPNRETRVSAEIQGKINEVLVDVGSLVTKGQSLLILDHSLLDLQLQTIDIQIGGLEADVNRYTILAKEDAIQGVQLEKAILGLKSAKVQRATLLEQISKATIKAPFDGVVTAKLSEEGAFAAPGVPLFQITDIRHLKFTVNVPENDLKQFKLHQMVRITVDAYSDISLQGKAVLIGSKANLGNSFSVQFGVTNTSDLKIKSGMFGKIILNSDPQEKSISIPSSAIVGSADQPQVYVIKNGKVILEGITIFRKYKDKALISSGLQEGDIIVTSGFINLQEGANIVIN